ncbi:MAG: 50S ribosomal protein L3 [Patescibacteria group bacterium]|uniref:Large ribosomal subunit protein uL3 n=1 Tax=candidate division WWE3 bacterium TaxID=2053526 RepID=A0A955ECZ0_UNCKA|nr:50S ribosomal protein L3 [candidate division WWE3 bacterium]
MEQVKVIGKKLNMTQIFDASGKVCPVTLISVENNIKSEQVGSIVTLVGTSKGKGFTGVMKKWNFSGQQATRGQSDKPRAAGSIGAQTPSKVFKGKKMAGRHGNYKITLNNVVIMGVDSNIIMVSGPVPGARNSKVEIIYSKESHEA